MKKSIKKNIDNKKKLIVNNNTFSINENNNIDLDLLSVGIDVEFLKIELNPINENNILVLKLISNCENNNQVNIYVENTKLPYSKYLYNKNWITYNFIDYRIFKNPKYILIDNFQSISNIMFDRIRNDNLLNFNQYNIDINKNTFIKNKPNLNLAIIADEFTFNNFDLEYNCVYIPNNRNFINNIIPEDFDLLICESCWNGLDKSWKSHISKFDNNIYGKNLFNLVNKFKKSSVKTIFYNKEDPISFNTFLNVSQLFDLIITTDSESVNKYIKHNKNIPVFSFPFIINPIIHNPINKKVEKLFAYPGTYYNCFKNRVLSMENNFKKLFDITKKNIDIYDRYFIKNKFRDQTIENKEKKYRFPDKYLDNIYPNLNHIQVSEFVYKKYKFVLNFNTVNNSSTMCSRRAIELAGCGTNIISDENKALRNIYGNDIIFFNDIKSMDILNGFDNINLNLYYITHLNFTIKNLMSKILESLNIKKNLEETQLVIIKNKNTKICQELYKKYIIFDKETYMEFDLKNFHKLYLLDENYFFDDKTIKKICLPLNFTNNHIFLTNNKNDYFKEESDDYLTDIYLLNKYNFNNKRIFINNFL